MAFLVVSSARPSARPVQAGCALIAHAPTTPRTNVTHSGYHVGHPNHPSWPACASRISVRASLHGVKTNLHVIKCNHFCEPPPALWSREKRAKCGSIAVHLPLGSRLPSSAEMFKCGECGALALAVLHPSSLIAHPRPSSSVFRLLRAARFALRCSRFAPQSRRSLVTR